MIKNYRNLRDRALYKLSKEVVIDKREYGILINMLLQDKIMQFYDFGPNSYRLSEYI